MFRDRRSLLVTGLLILLAAATWWLKEGAEPEVRFEHRPAHTPDYWVDRLSARTTDETGRNRRILSAESMRHYPDDDSTELTSPELLLLEPGKPHWRIRAESGWVSPDGELILLQGEVTVDRDAAEGIDPMHLTTRDLRIQPDDEYAETEQPVRGESGPNWVESRGMQVWLRQPVRIKLLAEVRARYEVNP